MSIEHSTDPLPLAGDTVIHGDSVMATQFPDELTLICLLPPAGPISILSVSMPNSISGVGTHDAAVAMIMAAVMILFISI